MAMETWWCPKCNTQIEVLVNTLLCKCARGHKMKKVSSKQELLMLQGAEGFE